MTVTELDRQALWAAKKLLEKPGLTIKITNLLGAPLEKGVDVLPRRLKNLLHQASEKSIHMAFEVANSTITKPPTIPRNFMHKALVAGTGGVSGFFGPMVLLAELPMSTTLMMRSIIEIASSEGENIHDPETRLACLEVFAFGGRSTVDDTAASSYLMTRAALARAFADASGVLLGKNLANESASALSRLIVKIAGRFQLIVSEKLAAQLVPLIGAVGGAGINVLFMDHFQDMARGHFTVRRLERKYGIEEVQNHYISLKVE